MLATALHFGNFVTARATKSIISSKCVFNPSYELPGVFKIKILYLSQTMDLEGQKPAKKHFKINYILRWMLDLRKCMERLKLVWQKKLLVELHLTHI